MKDKTIFSMENNAKTRKRLFVDMDGTLAVFNRVDKLETLYEKGYFENLHPMNRVLEGIKDIIKKRPDIQVHILSSVLTDSPYALDEKNAWLDKYLPEIDRAYRIFPPCGTDKKEYVPLGITENDFLLDDYTCNLEQWEPPARGIKLLNGINHTKGTWKKEKLNALSCTLADDVIDIIDQASAKDLQQNRSVSFSEMEL